MPHTRLFNVAGKEVFPPRPVNTSDDPDQTRLRIVIAPPGHFLAAETSPQIATDAHTTPLSFGRAVPIVEDDAPFVTIANGVRAQALNDTLQLPAFFSEDAFPEPVVEPDMTGDDGAGEGVPVAMVSPANDADEPVIRPPTRPMTAAEYRALEEEVKIAEERNRERLERAGVRTISIEEGAEIEGRDLRPDNPARSVAQPPMLARMSKDTWVKRRIRQLVSWSGVHPADAEFQAETEWDVKHDELELEDEE